MMYMYIPHTYISHLFCSIPLKNPDRDFGTKGCSIGTES